MGSLGQSTGSRRSLSTCRAAARQECGDSRLPCVNFWVTSMVIPIGVSGASGAVASLTVGPRLAARSTHIQAWHAARTKLADDLVKVMIACSALESTEAFSSNPKAEGERARWVSQVDEITVRLIDEGPAVALTHPNVLGTPHLITEYLVRARDVWLSDRPLIQRAAELREVVEPLHAIYGRRWWHGPPALARMRAARARVTCTASGEETPRRPRTPESA